MGTEGFRLGVDFGTSNTTAVLARTDGRVRPLLFDGSPVLPSGVYAEPDRDLLVGRDAAHAARIRPECFEPNPKRCVDDNTVLLGEVEVPVERMINAVLRRVAAEADPGGEDTPLDAVLTCPVGWGQHRRGRLLAAAEQVFRSVALVTEPVAAASYFVTSRRACCTSGWVSYQPWSSSPNLLSPRAACTPGRCRPRRSRWRRR